MLSPGFGQLSILFVLSAQLFYAQQSPPAAPLEPNNKIWIIYSEQQISDASRAQVCTLLAESVDQREWHSVPATKNTTLEALIDKYFDSFAKCRDRNRCRGEYSQLKYPRTTRVLINLIRRINGLKGSNVTKDEEVRIPPCPVRGNARYDYSPRIRTYQPNTQGYDFAPSFSELRFSDVSKVDDAKRMETERGATSTAVEIDLTGRSSQELQELGKIRNMAVRSTSGLAQVVLYENPKSVCGDAQTWLKESPYFPLLQQKLDSLTEAQKRALLVKAREMPLVIVDWGIDPLGQGHGAKVVSAAHFLLHSLNMDFLNEAIQVIDLYPRTKAQKKTLIEWLKNYQMRGIPQYNREQLRDDFTLAFKWINDPPVMSQGAQFYTVPEVLVQALFWQLSKKRAWINFSFSFHSPALRIVTQEFLLDRTSFALLAAGNENALNPSDVPQDSGSTRPNLVNVTHGGINGQILGSYTDEGSNAVVSVVAPGCGFKYETLLPVDSGSSYAAPFVAASSWLNYLLNNANVSNTRRQLLLATHLIPTQEHPSESRGIFDAARLLSSPQGAHYIDSNNHVRPIMNGKISFAILTDDGETFRQEYELRSSNQPNKTLVFYLDPHSQVRAFFREVKGKMFPQVDLHDGRLLAINIDLTNENGQRPPISGPESLRTTLVEISF